MGKGHFFWEGIDIPMVNEHIHFLVQLTCFTKQNNDDNDEK